MAGLALEDFGRNIIRSTANCPLLLPVKIKLGGEAEISELDLHFVVQEEIAQLEVTMDNAMRVQVLQSVDYLCSITLNFQFVKSFSTFKQFVHALVLAKFEQDVDILTVLEEVLEVADIGVLDAPVDLDFTHELLFGAALRQAGLLNDFGCVHEGGVGIYEFVAFRKAALAKELALDVSSDADFSRIFLKFFLNNGLRG